MGLHPAAKAEDLLNRGLGDALGRRGWRRVVLAYVGYGNESMLRVLARVVLVPGGHRLVIGSGRPDALDAVDRRGWRSFFTVVGPDVEVVARVGDAEHRVRTDRSGYLDVRLPNPGLAPGRHEVTLQVDDAAPTAAPVQVIGADVSFGLVSDIDDTVIRTWLPRPLIAANNTFFVREQARRPVSGMADFYRELLARHPGAPTVYVSTGAWNTERTLHRFLRRNGFPDGPLLLTDWGPTNTGWFRSGQQHKRTCLRALAEDFPGIRWLLVGDDGQHDPSLYADFAGEHPDRVRAIAIRQLSRTEQVLAHGTASERDGQDTASVPIVVPEVRAPDGAGLARELRRLDLL